MPSFKPQTSLAEFIDSERVAIVAEWETFARSLLPAATGMSAKALRDHADEILTAIVRDMKSDQTQAEQVRKSKGEGLAHRMGEMGRIHDTLRIEFGFGLGQMVAEYRALRASVLKLWGKNGTDPIGVIRFNEAIDEALTEAVDQFTLTTEHYRDQTLGMLGHDLRNPLTAIVMGATTLMSAEELSDQSVGIAARMLRGANRMARMIADLLDLTRTRFGDAIPIVPAPIDLEPVSRQVIAELEGQHPGGSIVLTCKGDLHGEWDNDRLAQVLSNLIRNAIQHGEANKPIEVVANGSAEDVVVLTIQNAGPPIPEKALVTIFEPMVRHTDNKQNTGLGLGLYIVSQVVIAHGGTVQVTSFDPEGTTFTVRLPRHAKAAAAQVGGGSSNPGRDDPAVAETAPSPAA